MTRETFKFFFSIFGTQQTRRKNSFPLEKINFLQLYKLSSIINHYHRNIFYELLVFVLENFSSPVPVEAKIFHHQTQMPESLLVCSRRDEKGTNEEAN